MNLTGYGHRLGVSHLAAAIVEWGLDVAGFLLNSGGPLPMSDVYVRRCATELTEIRKLLQDGRGHGKDVGERAEWPSGAEPGHSPTSPSSTSCRSCGHPRSYHEPPKHGWCSFGAGTPSSCLCQAMTLLETSALAPVARSQSPVDAAEQPRAGTEPHFGEDRPGLPNVTMVLDAALAAIAEARPELDALINAVIDEDTLDNIVDYYLKPMGLS